MHWWAGGGGAVVVVVAVASSSTSTSTATSTGTGALSGMPGETVSTQHGIISTYKCNLRYQVQLDSCIQ